MKNAWREHDSASVEIDIYYKHQKLKLLIDKEDLNRLDAAAGTIGAYLARYTFYAGFTEMVNGIQKRVYLHRFIMKPTKDLVVDHINHNGLDNRKSNLRNTTPSENVKNKGSYTKSYIPKRYTVRKRKDCNRYELQVRDSKPPNGFGLRYGGLFKSREAALESARKDWGLDV